MEEKNSVLQEEIHKILQDAEREASKLKAEAEGNMEKGAAFIIQNLI